jgi:hypothetical protein
MYWEVKRDLLLIMNPNKKLEKKTYLHAFWAIILQTVMIFQHAKPKASVLLTPDC